MIDKRDICERIEESPVHSYHTPMVSRDAAGLLLEAKAEIERLHTGNAEIEAQRNAAWRALVAAKALRAAQVAYMANRGNDEYGKRVADAASALDAEIAAAEATQEPKP